MKYIFKLAIIIALGLGFSGCAEKVKHYKKIQYAESLDFSKYQEKGFLITPGEYGADYTTIGIYTFTIIPESNYVEMKEKNYDGEEITSGKWVAETVNSQEILDYVYREAISKGANALTHFKIRSKQYIGSRKSLEIEGLLIKRKTNK